MHQVLKWPHLWMRIIQCSLANTFSQAPHDTSPSYNNFPSYDTYPSPVDAHHPVLAGEDLLKVLQRQISLADLRVAHAVVAVHAKLALSGRRKAAGRCRGSSSSVVALSNEVMLGEDEGIREQV
jgi:hypothetical protein